MHGLINRSIQNYVCDSYGVESWQRAVALADLPETDFEAMLSYEDNVTPLILDAVGAALRRPRDELMEDIGTYLVSHPNTEAVRRLLRFGGVNFADFLHSLDDLPARARLAVSDLHLPAIELMEHSDGRFSLLCDSPVAGYGNLLMGALRVMADDYGALALLDHASDGCGRETVSITLVEPEYTEGRVFDLGARTG